MSLLKIIEGEQLFGNIAKGVSEKSGRDYYYVDLYAENANVKPIRVFLNDSQLLALALAFQEGDDE